MLTKLRTNLAALLQKSALLLLLMIVLCTSAKGQHICLADHRKKLNENFTSNATQYSVSTLTVGVNARSSTLTWTATNESDIDRYEVMYSRDSIEWTVLEKIARAADKEGGQYKYTDKNAIEGIQYYCVICVEKNELLSVTNVVRVNIGAVSIPPAFYRNSTTAEVFMKGGTDEAAAVDLYNEEGELVDSQKVPPNGLLSIAKLETGIHTLRILQSGKITRQQILLIK